MVQRKGRNQLKQSKLSRSTYLISKILLQDIIIEKGGKKAYYALTIIELLQIRNLELCFFNKKTIVNQSN